MNDDQLLTAVRSSLVDSLADVHLDRPVAEITGRARTRRLRRGLSAGAVAAVALGTGLSLALTAGQTTGPGPARSVHVSLDAWSVVTTSNGQVELTLRELQHRALLEQALAKAGVPAIVNFNEFCGAANQADNLTATTGTHFTQRPVGSHGVLVALIINPAAVPAGVQVDIGVQDIGTGHGVIEDEIVKDGAPLSCHPIDVAPR